MGIASKMMPENATKHTHPEIRGIFKRLTLATGYGAGAESLAQWINASVGEAENLLRFHRRTFKQFWDWQDSEVSYALLVNKITTNYGWEQKFNNEDDVNIKAVQNYHMQAHGAHILKWAMMLLGCRGDVCAPVHDAVLIECDTDAWMKQWHSLKPNGGSIENCPKRISNSSR